MESISPISRIARISRHCLHLLLTLSPLPIPPPSFLLFFFWPHVSQDRRKSRDVPILCAPWYRKKRSVRFSITTVHAGGYADRKEEREREGGRGGREGGSEETKSKSYWKYAEGEEERYERGRRGMTKRERMRLELGTLLLLVGPH